MCQYEDDLSVAGNADVLKIVYRLSLDEYRKYRASEKDHTGMSKHIDLQEIRRKRYASNLNQYMKGLDMEVIKIIQTVMYIGRDYSYEKDIERYYEGCEYEEYTEPSEKKTISLKVDDPDLLLSAWMDDLTWAKGWNAKDIEVEQIYSKRLCLHKYMERAFEILGIQ